MKSFAFAGLLGLATLLAAIVFWEYSASRAAPLNPMSRQAVADARPEAIATAANRDQSLLASVLARPLFNPSRRPVPTGEVATSPKPASALPRLTGVLVSNTARSAIFASSPGGKAVVVTDGDWVGRSRVRSINAGQVVVTGPEGETVLRPTFAPASASSSAADTTGTSSAGTGSVGAPIAPVPDTGKPSVLDELRLRGMPSLGLPGLPAARDPGSWAQGRAPGPAP